VGAALDVHVINGESIGITCTPPAPSELRVGVEVQYLAEVEITYYVQNLPVLLGYVIFLTR
jgi:hypothetical protein